MPTPITRAESSTIVVTGEDFLAGTGSSCFWLAVTPVVSIGAAAGGADSADAGGGGAVPLPLDGGFTDAAAADAASGITRSRQH